MKKVKIPKGLKRKILIENTIIGDNLTALHMNTEELEKFRQEIYSGKTPKELPTIKNAFSTDNPKLKYGEKSMINELEVTVSSSQEEDEEVLHQLLLKTNS